MCLTGTIAFTITALNEVFSEAQAVRQFRVAPCENEKTKMLQNLLDAHRRRELTLSVSLATSRGMQTEQEVRPCKQSLEKTAVRAGKFTIARQSHVSRRSANGS